jgi:uncharacterized protein (UPF0297 family)
MFHTIILKFLKFTFGSIEDCKNKIKEYLETKYTAYIYLDKDKEGVKYKISTDSIMEEISKKYLEVKLLKKNVFRSILIDLGYTLKYSGKFI